MFLCLKNAEIQLDMVEHVCNLRYSGDKIRRITSSRLVRAKLGRACLKNKIQTKKVGGMTQVVEYFLSLSLIPSTTRRRKKKKKNAQDTYLSHRLGHQAHNENR
jgi:hypothetical protein